MSLEVFDFEDAVVVESSQYGEKLKLAKGEKARIFLIYKDGKAPFIIKNQLWVEADGNKYCVDTACIPANLEAKFKLEEAKQKFGALIVRYKVDKNGAVQKPIEWDINEWVFSSKKFLELKLINSEYALSGVDLNLVCNDEKFQSYSMTPCKGSLILASKLEKVVADKAEKMWESLDRSMGRKFSEEELGDFVGVKVSANIAPNVVASESELDAILAET